MTLQTSLSVQCTEIYDLSQLQAGLVYLPSGIGGALASYATGKLLDKNRRRVLNNLDGERNFPRGTDVTDFPIEKVRLVGVYALIVLSASSTAGYGVSLTEQTHISVPLAMQFISGAVTSSIFTICATLLTDLNTHESATAHAAYNIVRCIGAGAAISSLQPLAITTGASWCFGVFSIVMLLAAVPVYVLKNFGLRWRQDDHAVSDT